MNQPNLGNQPRPGLGAREDLDDGTKPLHPAKGKPTPHDREPLGRDAPLNPKTPREPFSDPRARDAERDTGMSGQSSGT